MSSSSTVKFASEEVIDRFLANVDVWQVIFEMLPVKARIRVEMTNKRLRLLMFEYWRRVTSFDTQCVTGICYNPSTRKNRKKRSGVFTICVDRIGAGLRSLTIRTVDRRMQNTLRSIGERCPNVETINFVSKGHMDIYFDSFSRLKTLTVSNGGKDYFACASASVFLSIPTSIEVIRGLTGRDEEPFENAAQLADFFADRPSLKEVSLGYLDTLNESKADIFRVIAERCPHLKSITLSSCYCIDYRGVVALDEMKELRVRNAVFDEMQIVTICERSPLVEALEFTLRFFNVHRQSAALNALGALTKLAELAFYSPDCYSASARVVAPSLVADFLRELARNSGASLRRLEIPPEMPLPTAAIEALANGCAHLREVVFSVRVGEATPASIRFLIDSIVAHPSWIHQTGERTLLIWIDVMHDGGDDAEAAMAAFKALADPVANLPTGVQLIIE